MTKLQKYQDDLTSIQKKISNLQNLEFNLQQKIQKLEKFPELNTEFVSKKKKNSSDEQSSSEEES